MNRNPNNERQGRTVPPPQRPTPGNQRPANASGPRPQRPGVPRNQIRPTTPQRDPREMQKSAPKKSSGFAKVVAVWVALLAIALAVILIVAFTANRDDNEESLPAVASTESTTVTTATEESIPVSDLENTARMLLALVGK